MEDSYGHIKDNVQKLTAALYRVTDLMSDREPIKWTLRDKSVQVYGNIMSIRENPSVYSQTVNTLESLIAMLSLFSMGIYVSKMNFEILSREYKRVKEMLAGERNVLFPDGDVLLKEMSDRLLSNNKNNGTEGEKEEEKQGKDLLSRRSSARERRLAVLGVLNREGPKTAKELAAQLSGASGKTIQRALSALIKDGLAESLGSRRWRRYGAVSVVPVGPLT